MTTFARRLAALALPLALAVGLSGRALATACSGATTLCSICAPNTCTVAQQPWHYELASWQPYQQDVYAAFGVWGTDTNAPNYSAVPCSSLQTVQDSVDSNPAAALSGDGKNTIGVNVTSSSGQQQQQYCYLNPASCQGGATQGVGVGLAVLQFGSGTVSECDVFFNSVDYQFTNLVTTPGQTAGPNNGSNIDVETVANQEVGHCFGLDHYLDDYQAVMYPTVAPGDTRPILEPHDINNICQLYPVAGAFGGPCGSGCTSGSCITDPGNGAQYCSTSCSAPGGSGCPTGYRCAATTSPSGNYCVAGTSVAGEPVGAPCAGNTDCGGSTAALCYPQSFATDAGTQNTGFYGGYCTAQCTAQADGGVSGGGCPAQSVCLPQSGGGSSICGESCAGFFPNACKRSDAATNPYNCIPLTQGQDSQGNPTFGNFVCYPGCQSNTDCNQGGQPYACDTATHSCVVTCAGDVNPQNASQNLCLTAGCGSNGSAICGTPGALVGAACTQDNDCPVGGSCITAANGFPGGYCAIFNCGENPSECGSNGSCVIFDTQANLGYCFSSCKQSSDCRQGYSCVSNSGSSAGPFFCYPSAAVTTDGGTSTSTSTSTSAGS
ncbi:MAG: matrixin family metalloprotease, partial [Deltaproteobacteria bacterium]